MVLPTTSRAKAVTRDARGTPLDLASASDRGLVSLCLPEGDYTLSPVVTSLNPGGGTTVTDVRPVDVGVCCSCIVDVQAELQISVDPVPCSSDGNVTITGSVNSDPNINVVRIFHTLNGGPEVDVCLNCGEDPSFSFTVTLAATDNTIKVTAIDELGTEASVTTFTRFAPPPQECKP